MGSACQHTQGLPASAGSARSSRRLTGLLLPGLLSMLPLLGGCSNLGFYLQAVSGHMDMMSRRQPVAQLLIDPATPDELREQLRTAQAARDFASQALLLPENDSYRSYADLQRPYVTWNVVAAPEFSVEAKTWCYVHMVCLPYRGYFNQAEGEAYASRLEEQGYDVHTYGVAAYSTSGWFDDPLLNTMMRQGERRMVSLIFHELAHQQLFLKRDGAFSEAFATFVEQEGWRRWLRSRGDHAGLEAFAVIEARRADFLLLLRQTRGELKTLYAQALEADEMRSAKARVFARMRESYAELKQSWGGYAGYDGWFERPLNNARLALVATYNEWVPAFERLLETNAGDLAAFYREAEALSELPAEARRQRLQELGAGRVLEASAGNPD